MFGNERVRYEKEPSLQETVEFIRESNARILRECREIRKEWEKILREANV